MHRKKVIAIVVVGVIVIGIALGLALHVSRILAESRAVEISKQSSVVQGYLSQHPNAESKVMKLYVKSDGSVYTVNDIWELKRYVGGTDKPMDGEDHYCWRVHWYDPTSIIPHIVNVFIDKDCWEIILEEEAR